ncbi:MAG: 50S ribosomal protein L6 [Persicimonas sp.]
MSRVGKRPIEVPEGVEVSVDGQTVEAKGPQGELTRRVTDEVDVELVDGELRVVRPDDSRRARSNQGLVRSLLANMIAGVVEGFRSELEIHGVGYRAEKHGDYVRFDLGFSHPILFELPEQVDVEIEKQTELVVSSPDKDLLGQITSKMRDLRPPEPYKGKGIRYKGERIIRKVGKAGAA